MANPITDDFIDQGTKTASPARLLLGGPFGVEPIEESDRRLDRFAAAGGRLVETARSYKGGRAEDAIGQWLGANPGVLRIMSKVGHDSVTKGDIPLEPRAVTEHVRASLDALQVERLDILLYHCDDPTRSVEELADTLRGLVDGGLVARVGASNWTLDRFAPLAVALRERGLDPIASYQFGLAAPDPAQLKAGNLATDADILTFLDTERIPLFAWSAQAGGFFSRTEPATGESRSRMFETLQNEARRERCRELAAQFGVAPGTLALAWTLHRPGTWAAIGPRTAEQLDGSLEALQIRLTDEQAAWLAFGNE